MKNILIVITQAENAGAQKAVLKLYDYLKSDFNVKIIYLYVQDEEYYKNVQTSYNVLTLMKNRNKKELVNLLNIRNIVKDSKIDLVFTYTHWSNILVPLLLFGLSIKIIANKRGALWKYPKVRFLESLILKINKVEKVICVSKSLYDEALKVQKVEESKIIHIPNGISCSKMHNNIIKNQLILKILFVGRLHEQKGIKYLLEGFNQVILNGNRNIQLTICGDGDLKQYVYEFIKTNNLSNFIDVKGNIKNINDYYISHDILISTSLWEGFPNVLLEASCFELPIIATGIDGNLELIEHKKTGYIIKDTNSKEVKESLEYAYHNYNKFQYYAKELKTVLREKFDDTIIKSRYMKVINEVIN